MTSFRRCDGSGNGFQVSHLSYQDHIRVFSECSPQCLCIIRWITADLPLVYHRFIMSVQIFDRILQCNNMVRIIPVDYMNQWSQCSWFPASCRSCYQNETSFPRGHLHYLCRNTKILRFRDVERKASHNGSKCSSLFKHIYAKTSHTWDGICEVRLSIVL